MNTDFKLYQEIIKYDKYIRRYVAPVIPSVHRDLKIHLLDESYNLERGLLEAQYTRGNIRMKHMIDIKNMTYAWKNHIEHEKAV